MRSNSIDNNRQAKNTLSHSKYVFKSTNSCHRIELA